jgi:phosphoglycolate phosphatase-like HAD superfamily hydrolase
MPIALFDLDGTLVDSNYHQAMAWSRAFAQIGRRPELWRIHRTLGMGGDQLVAKVTDEATEREHGDRLRELWREQFEALIGEVVPVSGARDLLARLHGSDWIVVLASSSPSDIVERYVDLLDARTLVRGWTTADDAERTKPAPDLVHAALSVAGGGDDSRAVMIGDSTWDVIAAAKADIPTVAVRAGGYGADELTEAGAVAVLSHLGGVPAAIAEAVNGTGAGAPGHG